MPYQSGHRPVAQKATPCVTQRCGRPPQCMNLTARSHQGWRLKARRLGLREFSSGWPPLGFHRATIFRRDRSLALDQGRIGTASRFAVGDQPPNCETRARATSADLRPPLARDGADTGRRDAAGEGRGDDARVRARKIPCCSVAKPPGRNGRHILLPGRNRKLKSWRRWPQLIRLRDAKPYRCRSSPNSPSF